MGRIVRLCAIGVVVITLGSIAMWGAIIRLAVRAEEALYALRVRVFDHILGLDLADHEEERRGSLVASVTSDIETLSQFFSWGGIAWLLDGTMIIVTAAVMMIYDWRLALIALFAAAPLVLLLRVVQRHLVQAYSDVRERNAELLTTVSRAGHRLGGHPCLPPRAPHDRRGQDEHRPPPALVDPGRHHRRVPVPLRRAVLGPDDRRRPDRRHRHGSGRRPHDRRDGGLHLPLLPVPRAGRGVHRDPRPDPDRGGRLAPGARDPGAPDHHHRSRRRAVRCPGRRRRSSSTT